MATPFPKTGKVERKWFLVDLDGKILGRAASRVAHVLKGKHKATYTPHLDTGDHIVAINASKMRLTGKKLDQKMDYRHSGFPGGDRYTPYRVLMQDNPERAFQLAVKGMLPKNSIGRTMLKKLVIYSGEAHQQSAQKPVKLEI